MKPEKAIVMEVRAKALLVEDDFGDSIYVALTHVVGTPRLGATCTLVPHINEGPRSYRAFIEPQEDERVSRNPDESGVVFVGENYLKRLVG
jgi:hypothetical protein